MSHTNKKLSRFKDLIDSVEKKKRNIEDNLGNMFNSLSEASKFHKISVQTVCYILKGRHSKTRNGIIFKYA